MNRLKTYTVDELLDLPSEKLIWIMEECRQVVSGLIRDYTESICEYKAIEAMLPHKLAVIQVEFLDKGVARNEAMDRAKASPQYLAELQKLQDAYNRKKPLEIKFEAMQMNLKCITSIAYVKNSELKNNF